MRKILICNLDLLRHSFNGYPARIFKEVRNKFVSFMNQLSIESENIVCFVSRNSEKINIAKKIFDEYGYDKFIYKMREEIKYFIRENTALQNYFVFISGKEVDFHLAVQTKALFIVPLWIPTEEKARYYGVAVDSPKQLIKFIRTLNNHNCVYEYLNIELGVDLFALVDARYKKFSSSQEEKEMLIAFEKILKSGEKRNYYSILMYHFLAGMTRNNFLDDIELYGMIPSSDGSVNLDLFNFMTQTRLIKGKRLPKNKLYEAEPQLQNLFIRHTAKQKAHKAYNFEQRMNMGCRDEFKTLCINPAFKEKIEKLKKQKRFNVCIFDDYTTFGNSFNAVRNLLKYLGANKIVFISLGSFAYSFIKNDYIIKGDVFSPYYEAELTSCDVLKNAIWDNNAKKEVNELYDIFNS